MNHKKIIIICIVIIIIAIFSWKRFDPHSQTLISGNSIVSPYDKPNVIDINVSEILAEKVKGGIVVRGAWDRVDQGIFTPIENSESFTRLKNSEGAPTPYFRAGDNIYMFKMPDDSEWQIAHKTSDGRTTLLIPVKIDRVDVDSFVPGLSTSLNLVAKDKNHVYINGVSSDKIFDQKIYPDYKIDVGSVEPLNNTTSYIFKDKNHIYYFHYRMSPYFVTPFDPKTYVLLTPDPNVWGFTYEKDKKYVFIGERQIEGADPETFMVFTEPKLVISKGGYILYQYSKDKNHVYYSTEYDTEIIKNADPKTFEVFISPTGNFSNTYHCGKDKYRMYLGTTTISSIAECGQRYSVEAE